MDGLHHSSPLSPTDPSSDDLPPLPSDDPTDDTATPITTTRLPSLSSSAPRAPLASTLRV